DLPEPDPEYATNCRDTVTFTWGAQSEANMFRVEIGDAITGPWEVYTETIPGNATGVTLNNYFGGAKYLRLSVNIDGPGGEFWAPFAIKQPQAPVIEPPQFIDLTNATQSAHP